MFKLNTESSTERIGDRKRFPGITIAGFSMHSSYIFFKIFIHFNIQNTMLAAIIYNMKVTYGLSIH